MPSSPKPPPAPTPQAVAPAPAPIRPARAAGMDAVVGNPERARLSNAVTRRSLIFGSAFNAPVRDDQFALGSGY